MDKFFNTLLEAGVNPLVVLDGINPDEKADTTARRRVGKLKIVARLFPDDDETFKKQPTEKDRTRPYYFLMQ